MTADERIEKLLNRFGQTIEDLPKPDRNPSRLYGPYSSTSRLNYYHAAREWSGWDSRMPDMALSDYGCHLCDVIDKLEIALETATRWMPCDRCEKEDNCQDMDCNLSMKDRYLGGSCID